MPEIRIDQRGPAKAVRTPFLTNSASTRPSGLGRSIAQAGQQIVNKTKELQARERSLTIAGAFAERARGSADIQRRIADGEFADENELNEALQELNSATLERAGGDTLAREQIQKGLFARTEKDLALVGMFQQKRETDQKVGALDVAEALVEDGDLESAIGVVGAAGFEQDELKTIVKELRQRDSKLQRRDALQDIADGFNSDDPRSIEKRLAEGEFDEHLTPGEQISWRDRAASRVRAHVLSDFADEIEGLQWTDEDFRDAAGAGVEKKLAGENLMAQLRGNEKSLIRAVGVDGYDKMLAKAQQEIAKGEVIEEMFKSGEDIALGDRPNGYTPLELEGVNLYVEKVFLPSLQDRPAIDTPAMVIDLVSDAGFTPPSIEAFMVNMSRTGRQGRALVGRMRDELRRRDPALLQGPGLTGRAISDAMNRHNGAGSGIQRGLSSKELAMADRYHKIRTAMPSLSEDEVDRLVQEQFDIDDVRRKENERLWRENFTDEKFIEAAKGYIPELKEFAGDEEEFAGHLHQNGEFLGLVMTRAKHHFVNTTSNFQDAAQLAFDELSREGWGRSEVFNGPTSWIQKPPQRTSFAQLDPLSAAPVDDRPGFSVFEDQYWWEKEMTSSIKKELDEKTATRILEGEDIRILWSGGRDGKDRWAFLLGQEQVRYPKGHKREGQLFQWPLGEMVDDNTYRYDPAGAAYPNADAPVSRQNSKFNALRRRVRSFNDEDTPSSIRTKTSTPALLGIDEGE